MKWIFNCIKSSSIVEIPIGISVHCLRHTLLREVEEAGLNETSTIYEIEDVIKNKSETTVSPIDNTLGAAYVDCLVGHENIGPADRILSYASAYTIGYIIDTLEEYCSNNCLDPKQTYIWICCICSNQHRVGMNVSFDTFHANVRNTMTSIGRVLAMVAPLDKPVYLTRLWCLFELFNACDVEIIMPPQQKQTMLKGLGGYNAFVKALCTIDITKAEVSKENDRAMIMQLIERRFGISTFNNKVNNLLAESIFKMVSAAVNECAEQSEDASIDLDYADLCFNVGQVMLENETYDTALALYYKGLEVREKVYGKEHTITVDTYNKIGLMMHENNDLENALAMFEKALAAEEKIHGKDHTSIADTCCNIGLVRHDMQYLDTALEMFLKALAIEERVYGKNHASTAGTYFNIGGVMKSKRRNRDALEWYQKALAAEKIAYGDEHEETVTTKHEIRELEIWLAKL